MELDVQDKHGNVLVQSDNEKLTESINIVEGITSGGDCVFV